MDSSKLSIKLFVADGSKLGEITDFVPVFHSWIQTHAIAGHLLIDVADYAHVHDGPGIVLVAHEANYSLDSLKGRLGLTYQRKQAINGTPSERIRVVYQNALAAAKLLEDRLSFRMDELEFKIHDRLSAPNTTET